MKRILFAEDNDDLRRMIVHALAPESFAIVQAADGREALQAIEHEQFDLLLLDAAMPIKSGIEVAAYARDKGYDMPILLYTAYSEPMMHALAKRYKASILRKDSAPAELVNTIRRMLDA